MTIRELATRSGVGRSTIGFLKTGQRGKRGLPAVTAQKLAAAFDVDAEWLRTGKGAPGGGLVLHDPSPPATADPCPNRQQALALLKGLVAPQVEEALRREPTPKGDLPLERWLDRARALQRLFDEFERDLAKKLGRTRGRAREGGDPGPSPRSSGVRGARLRNRCAKAGGEKKARGEKKTSRRQGPRLRARGLRRGGGSWQ